MPNIWFGAAAEFLTLFIKIENKLFTEILNGWSLSQVVVVVKELGSQKNHKSQIFNYCDICLMHFPFSKKKRCISQCQKNLFCLNFEENKITKTSLACAKNFSFFYIIETKKERAPSESICWIIYVCL